MNWKLEIYRAFFLAFGIFEVIANTRYLFVRDGIKLARKQHQELPRTATSNQYKAKVICMLISGICFFLTGLYSYIQHGVNNTYYSIMLICFAIYAVIEGVYYRYWKTFGFSTISVLFLLIFLI
ncbi:hypothetical protein IAI10_09380 [Clostridium sp. 19966]|uniref:hypothetical protein n=1 Tax=Clostridium sp. 19966 TaxID=2768166 RepID=UPI0028DECFDD|nr:hypothetical protein [Clostridium sp. 19966]MDT8716869.1 hypothetical protein [Clostridium sp. 19966]